MNQLKSFVCKYHSTLFFWLLVGISLTLPFSIKYNSILIILLVVCWLVYQFSIRSFTIRNPKLFITIFLLFIAYIYGAFISSNIAEALKDVEQKLSLFILPLVLASIPILVRKKVRVIIAAFIVSCFIVSVLTFREGFGFLDAEHRVWAMQGILLMHRPILGLYCASCIFFVLALVAGESRPYMRLFGVLLAVWFFLFMIILNAKMSFIALVVSFFLVFMIYLFQKRNKRIGALAMLIVTASFYIVYLKNKALNSFVTALINFEPFSYERYNSMMVDSFNVRFGIWKCCKEVLSLKGVWLTGTGTGDSKLLLKACYIHNDYMVQAQDMLNAHNQYLESWIALGIVGLLLLVCVFVVAFITGVSQKQFIFYSFIILYAICAISESLLNTQKGIVIFTLFYSLFAFHFHEGNDVIACKENNKL